MMVAIFAIMLAVARLTERWGVSADHVRDLISSGQLPAIDVSLNPGRGKARWRIPLAAVEEFEKQRTSKPSAPKQRRRRKSAKPRKEFF